MVKPIKCNEKFCKSVYLFASNIYYYTGKGKNRHKKNRKLKCNTTNLIYDAFH